MLFPRSQNLKSRGGTRLTGANLFYLEISIRCAMSPPCGDPHPPQSSNATAHAAPSSNNLNFADICQQLWETNLRYDPRTVLHCA
jgi:hypothetical protein